VCVSGSFNYEGRREEPESGIVQIRKLQPPGEGKISEDLFLNY